MKEIDLNNIKSEDLVDYSILSEAFKNYLMNVLGYDESEAKFVVSADFENPYDTPYIMQEYAGECCVGEKEYLVRFCYTDFRVCGLFHLEEFPPFEFYMFIDLETLPDNTVGSYMNAEKLYLV